MRPPPAWATRARCLAAGALLAGASALAAPAAPSCPPPPPDPALLQTVVVESAGDVASGGTAAAPQPDRGPLWRVERDGLRGWLYGTLHVGRAPWRTGPRVRQALQGSAVLALELDPLDASVAAALQGAALRPETRAVRLDAALSARLAAAARQACLDEQALAALHPSWQVLQLTLVQARRDGLEPLFAQELVLALLARRLGKAVVSLETPQQQLDALLPGDAGQVAAEVDRSLQTLESGRAGPLLRRIEQAWTAGDLATLGDPAAWCDCTPTAEDRAALARLNDRRNEVMAQRLDARMRDGPVVFAAVGALHLSGPLGLPALLAQRGYRVVPVLPADARSP